MRIIKIIIFLFLFSFTTHAFAKSNEYYQSVITNIITNCKTDQCRKDIFEQEVHIAFFNLLDAILNQVQFEISKERKKNYGQTNCNYNFSIFSYSISKC